MTNEQLIKGNELTEKINQLEKSLNKIVNRPDDNTIGIALGGAWLSITEDMANGIITYITETLENEIHDTKEELEKL